MGDGYKDGLLEDGLNRYFEQVWAEKHARGDYGAAEEVDMAIEWVARAEHTGHLNRAVYHMQKAGVLAVKEALFHGKIINGWEDAAPNFAREYEGWGWPLRELRELPDEYQAVANLYDNALLRDIRQTGSRLIPADRELRFAEQRVEEAQAALSQEQLKLEKLKTKSG